MCAPSHSYIGLAAIPYSANNARLTCQAQQDRYHALLDEEWNVEYNLKRAWQLEREDAERRQAPGRALRERIARMHRDEGIQVAAHRNKYLSRKQRAIAQFGGEWQRNRACRGYPFWGQYVRGI